MDIILHTQPAPSVEPRILAELDSMYPRVFIRWNPRYELVSGEDKPWRGTWEGRWGLWVELLATAHPGLRDRIHQRTERDVWDSAAQCWVRYLQAYTNADDSFAPADERLIAGLELADTWANRRFYEDHVESVYDREEARLRQAGKDAMADASRYYRKFENPIVGRYVNSGWRAKLGL